MEGVVVLEGDGVLVRKIEVVKMEGYVKVDVKGLRGFHEWSCGFEFDLF